jgi:hypothetical protein
MVELVWAIGREAGVSRWIFAVIPALFAMLYSLLVYQRAERTIQQLGQSISRGILVMLLTWASLAAMLTWARCEPRDFSYCFGLMLTASGVLGGGPLLLCGLGAGMLTGFLIIRMPKPRIA